MYTHTTYVFYLLHVRTCTNLHVQYIEKLEINGNNFLILIYFLLGFYWQHFFCYFRHLFSRFGSLRDLDSMKTGKEKNEEEEREKELHGKLIGLGRSGAEEENKNCFHPCFRIYIKTFE